MSLNLYQEAIVEAKQLREMAEQNAKNKIIDAITPKIRRLIEQQLVDDEFEEEEESELVIGDEEAAPSVAAAPPVDQGAMTLDLDALAPALPAADTGGEVGVSVSPGAEVEISIEDDGSVEIDTGEITLDLGGASGAEEEEEILLSQEGFSRMDDFLSRYGKERKLKESLDRLHRKTRLLSETLSNVNLNKTKTIYRQTATLYYANLLREAYSLSDKIILINESIDERLEYQLLVILKEIKTMSRRRDAVAFRRLFEQLTAESGLYEQEDEELDLGAEDEVDVEEEEVEVDAPAAQDALGDLAVALGMEVVEEEEGEEVEVDVEEEETLELEEADETDEGDDDDEGDLDEIYEIDESSLRRELRRIRRLREQDTAVGRAAEADPYLAHGGEDEGTIDVDEDTLINALADELGDPGVPTPDAGGRPPGGSAMPESYRRRLRRRARARGRVNESRRRTTRRSAAPSNRRALQERQRVVKAERATVQLKKQLKEMNLFNAKLLFANKLMQNRALSTKQQRTIVEALDSAKTIREAKLLYKGLSNAINRRSGGTLTEGRSRLLASSSRSTRSAAPANSGAEVDRWALLAGINGDNN